MTILTKFQHNVDNAILKYHHNFQVDKSVNARVIAVESLQNFYTFILPQPCWWAKECPPTHFTMYQNKKKLPASLACNSALNGPSDFKFGTNTFYVVLQIIPKFGGN